MRTYVLYNIKNGKTLYPKESLTSAEIVHDSDRFSLDEYFLKSTGTSCCHTCTGLL